jgi:hypothetical protein
MYIFFRTKILIAIGLYILYNYKVRDIYYSIGMFSPFTGHDDSAITNKLKVEYVSVGRDPALPYTSTQDTVFILKAVKA